MRIVLDQCYIPKIKSLDNLKREKLWHTLRACIDILNFLPDDMITRNQNSLFHRRFKTVEFNVDAEKNEK